MQLPDKCQTSLLSHVTSGSANMATSSESSECSESTLRKRRFEPLKPATNASGISTNDTEDTGKYEDKKKEALSLRTGTYWLNRIVLLRSIGFIYCEWVD